MSFYVKKLSSGFSIFKCFCSFCVFPLDVFGWDGLIGMLPPISLIGGAAIAKSNLRLVSDLDEMRCTEFLFSF